MRVYAHRGTSSEHPESVIVTNGRALEAGVCGIDLNVPMSSDGVPVVIHDATLEQTRRQVLGRTG